MRGIWGSAHDDIYAVGDSGTILHFDGDTWSELESGTTAGLYGVWGSSPTDVYAVGETGTVLHYDGIAWSEMATGTTAGLLGVWGSSATDVYAVGETGTILHYDGVSWSAVESGTDVDLYGVWGSSGTNVYAVGGQGTILHYTDDAVDGTCLIKNLYGEHSETVARMRLFRDARLAKTLGGRMTIRAYYALSPLMVKTIGYDEGLKGAV